MALAMAAILEVVSRYFEIELWVCVPQFGAGLWDDGVGVSPWVILVPILVMIFALVLDPYLSTDSDVLVFLDATCINQFDTICKTEGVESLSGFLAKSEELHILWSPPWCKRKWCLYELAIYAAIQRNDSIVFYPLFLECANFWLFIGLGIINISNALMVCGESQMQWLVYPTTIIIFSAFVYFALIHVRELAELDVQLSTFDISTAECRDVADSDFIAQSIRHWYGDESSFNQYVRGPLREKVLHGANGAVTTYQSLLRVSFPVACFTVAVVSAHALAGMEPMRFVSFTAIELADTVFAVPLAIKIVLSLAWRARSFCKGTNQCSQHCNKIMLVVETMIIVVVSTLLYAASTGLAIFLHGLGAAGGMIYLILGAILAGSLFGRTASRD